MMAKDKVTAENYSSQLKDIFYRFLKQNPVTKEESQLDSFLELMIQILKYLQSKEFSKIYGFACNHTANKMMY